MLLLQTLQTLKQILNYMYACVYCLHLVRKLVNKLLFIHRITKASFFDLQAQYLCQMNVYNKGTLNSFGRVLCLMSKMGRYVTSKQSHMHNDFSKVYLFIVTKVRYIFGVSHLSVMHSPTLGCFLHQVLVKYDIKNVPFVFPYMRANCLGFESLQFQ